PSGPGGAGGWRPAQVVLAVIGVVLVVVLAAGVLIQLPYVSIAPGSARRVDDLIKVEGHPVYPAKGRVLFTTVAVREDINLWEAVGGWLDDDVSVLSEKQVRGPHPREEYHEMNVEAMADSKAAAEAVALRHLGFRDLSAGAEVQSVEPGLPAASVVQEGDVIVGIDGKPVKEPAEVVAGIRAHQPGDEVRLTVVGADGPPTDRTATLARGEQGQALLGVRLTTKLELPFTISIDSGNIEGPSAGLPYSLALLDELTPGELTGGAKVAATGELGSDGRVGPIGGVAQKAVAVRRAGAALFLVPRANYDEARAHAGSRLRVAAIDSFDDALRAMADLPGSNAGSLAQAAPGT
ncbi:MAG TPA: S16 family serine protease, partial [Acidimicrobiales bacterium]|nr:S16 family serine protease [Acidimicrobiales bacterium]